MARHLGVHRNTVSNYIHGRTRPPGGAVKVWAQVTGFDLAWLAGDDYPNLIVDLTVGSGETGWTLTRPNGLYEQGDLFDPRWGDEVIDLRESEVLARSCESGAVDVTSDHRHLSQAAVAA